MFPSGCERCDRTRREAHVCPYKGEARYWTVGGVDEAALSYDYPRPEATGIAGHVAFDPERVDVQIG